MYGAVLLAAYDPDADVFRTVGKCGTGFSDAELAGLPARLAPYRVDHRPALVDARQTADVWFEPGLVLEVLSAELTLSPNSTAGWGQLKRGLGAGDAVPAVHRPMAGRQEPAGRHHHDRARPALPAGPPPGVTVETAGGSMDAEAGRPGFSRRM